MKEITLAHNQIWKVWFYRHRSTILFHSARDGSNFAPNSMMVPNSVEHHWVHTETGPPSYPITKFIYYERNVPQKTESKTIQIRLNYNWWLFKLIGIIFAIKDTLFITSRCIYICLQLTKSGEHTVTLREVPRIISGKYQCEVSADAPLFHTETSTAKMLVAELPAQNPILSVYNAPNSSKNGIAIGELLKATCVSKPSFPPVNFTWTINGNIHPVSTKAYFIDFCMRQSEGGGGSQFAHKIVVLNQFVHWIWKICKFKNLFAFLFNIFVCSV